MEPLSVTALAVEAAEATEVAAMSALKESAINEVAFNLERQGIAENIEHATNLSERLLSPTKADMQTYKRLFQDIEAAKANPETQRALFNSITRGSNLKGQLGEYISKQQLSPYGDLATQLKEGSSRLDLVVDRLRSNIKLQEVVIENNEIKLADFYAKEGQSLALEVKNGGLNYLKQEARSGHLLEQLKAAAGHNHQLVGISRDLIPELINEPAQSTKGMVEQIIEHGRIVVSLPGEETQITVVKGLLRV